MFRKTVLIFLTLALMASFAGCNTPAAATLAPTALPVDNQATIDAAVAATQTALAAAATPTMAQPTLAAPLPTPTPVPTEDLGQEELAAEIDEAAQATLDASNQVYSAYGSYAVDGVLTAEEVQWMLDWLYYADDLYYQYEELAELYYDLYGEYYDEAIDLLYEIEDDLTALYASMLEIENILEQGEAAASAVIDQLNTLYETYAQQISDAQQRAQDWLNSVKATLDARELEALATQASEIASTRLGALQQARAYGEGLLAALQDKKIAPEELELLQQSAANAIASLKAVGGAQMDALADQAMQLTSLMARGQMPKLNFSLDSYLGGIPRP